MSEYVLEAKNIVKIFPGVRALDGVDLRIRPGEVHAIVGENGAGKSTLMLTLGGIHKPDEGEIYIDGEKVTLRSARDAQSHGISTVFQELSLVPTLSVAENIFANRQPVSKLNFINKKKLEEMTEEMLSLFHLEGIAPTDLVRDLSIANQQVIEILKAMSFHPKVMILDEPTSSLTDIEVKRLFENIRILKQKGIAFIYISHHLNEIFEIADRVTILRDGKYIDDANVSDINEDYLVTKMVGRKIENIYGAANAVAPGDAEVFRAEGICRKGVFHNVSFHVNAGEIVGFSGLVGAGRTEIGRAIFGAEPIDGGTMYLNGEKIVVRSPGEAISKGIGYMSEDRKQQGLYLGFDIKANLIANRLKDFARGGFLQSKAIQENAEKDVETFGVATPSTKQIVGNLSGGNQQKVLLAAWFGIKPKLLIVDEPTRGVDVGAKSDIYRLLRALAAQGVAVIMISSDLPEVLGVSDRIVVIKEGSVAGEIPASEATEEKVIAMAAGTAAEIGG